MMQGENLITDPKVVALLKALGIAYLENREYTKASDKFKQLVSQNFEDDEIVLNHALALTGMQATSEEALHAYARATTRHPNDENLFLSLSTLFINQKVVADPALRVLHKSLSFSSPQEPEIRAALEAVFSENTGNIAIPEIKKTLLESGDNPELLNLFLRTALRDNKFDDALEVLKSLHAQSKDDSFYAQAFCDTLLRKKASAEELNHPFSLSAHQAHFCFKQFNPEKRLTRIHELETYLDFRNLLLAIEKQNPSDKGAEGEYEIMLMDNAIENIDEVTQSISIPPDFEPSFRLAHDLLSKINDSESAAPKGVLSLNGNGGASQTPEIDLTDFPTNTFALFEITNYENEAETSKLPFQTFLKLICGDMLQSREIKCAKTADGMVALATNPRKMVTEATEIIEKLQRYNQVVDDSEVIHMRITLHCTPLPFGELENDGIRELRKTVKIHNRSIAEPEFGEKPISPSELETDCVMLSEQVVSQVSGLNSHKTGNFNLTYFPQEHILYKIAFTEDRTENKTEVPTFKEKRHFGKYEVTETLRQAPFSSTYRGYDTQLERPVIIKAHRVDAFAAHKDTATLRKQFYDEVRRFNRINHPNIGVIYDAGEEENTLYLVREHIEGKNLRSFLMTHEKPGTQEILEIFVGICRVLSQYHKSQIWHKNLKPENIFIMGAHKEIKVVDGSLLQLRYTESAEEFDADTMAYLAPEQIQGQTLTETCDIFQIGTLLYESLTGTHPFKSEIAPDTRLNILADTPLPASTIKPGLPLELDRILTRALDKIPEQRFATITDFQTELLDFFDDREVSTRRRMYELLK